MTKGLSTKIIEIEANELFPNVDKFYKQIDRENQLNKSRYDYIQSIHDRGMNRFLKEIYRVEDIKLFAKMSADIINDNSDILTLIKHLNYCVYKLNDDKFKDNFSLFMRTFIEAKIISCGSYSKADLSNLTVSLRALYLSILPYRLYLLHVDKSETKKEVEELYWRCFSIDSTIKLVDLDYIIPKLINVENYLQLKNVLAFTFQETGVISAKNLKVFIKSLSKIYYSNDSSKSSDLFMLLEMFDYINHSTNNEKLLIDLEVYLLTTLKERDYYFNYPFILGKVFREPSDFILLYEQAYALGNNEESKYLISILFNNTKGIFRFNHFYKNQETFIEWYKDLTFLSREKSYYNDLQYLLGIIALSFTLKDNNIPSYEILELLDSIENTYFLRGYSENQIITVLENIKFDKLVNKSSENSNISLNELYYLSSYDLKINWRIEELKKIKLRAELAGYYNVASCIDKSKKH